MRLELFSCRAGRGARPQGHRPPGAPPLALPRPTASTTTGRRYPRLPQVHDTRSRDPLTLMVEVEVDDGPRKGHQQQEQSASAALVTQRSIAGAAAARGSGNGGRLPAAPAAKRTTRLPAAAAVQQDAEVADGTAAAERQAEGGGRYLLPLPGPHSVHE